MADSRYQCPHCSRSSVDRKRGGRFCSQFTAMLSEEERKEAKFARFWFGLWITNECRRVFRGWNWKCAGFRKQVPEMRASSGVDLHVLRGEI